MSYRNNLFVRASQYSKSVSTRVDEQFDNHRLTKPIVLVETEREASQSPDGMRRDKPAYDFKPKTFQERYGVSTYRELIDGKA